MAKLYIASSDSNVSARVCQDCGHIKLYEHSICHDCGSENTRLLPSAEEYATHDHGGFAPFTVSEYSNIDELVHMADIIIGLDRSENSIQALSFLSGLYEDLDIIKDKIDDVQIFHGTRADYA